MANTLITPSIIAKEALFQLENNLVMGDKVHRQYRDEFVKIGDTVTVRVTVKEKLADNRLRFACECLNQDDETVIDGEAVVIAPAEKVRRPRAVLPERLRGLRP